jgi:hypothetical protein
VPGERVPVSWKMSPESKARIERAAEESGRSMSQEIELRLEQSFEREDRAPALLEAVYGRRLADLLRLLGRTMQDAGLREAYGLPFERRTGPLLDWSDNKAAAREAVLAARQFIFTIGGDADLPHGDDSWGVHCAGMALSATGSAYGADPPAWFTAGREAAEHFRKAAIGEEKRRG